MDSSPRWIRTPTPTESYCRMSCSSGSFCFATQCHPHPVRRHTGGQDGQDEKRRVQSVDARQTSGVPRLSHTSFDFGGTNQWGEPSGHLPDTDQWSSRPQPERKAFARLQISLASYSNVKADGMRCDELQTWRRNRFRSAPHRLEHTGTVSISRRLSAISLCARPACSMRTGFAILGSIELNLLA